MPVFQNSTFLHIAGPAEKPVVVCVTGNPGVAQYYTEYIGEIHNRTGLECVVLGQLGSDIQTIAPYTHEGLAFTLEDQINHKVDFLAEHYKGRKVYLMGHSIGAWMVQRVCMRCKDIVQIQFVGLLTPTLNDIAQSDRGVKLTWFKQNAGHLGVSLVVGIARCLNALLPLGLLRRCVDRMHAGVSGAIRSTTVEMARRPAILRQILVMGFEEMDRVNGNWEDPSIKGFWAGDYKIWLMYAREDHWVPNSTREATIKRAEAVAKNIKVNIIDVPHAFVLKYSLDMASDTVAAFP